MKRMVWCGMVMVLSCSAAAQEAAETAVAAQTPVATTSAATQNRFVVDAKVGHIYGKNVYASEIFKEIGEEQLATLARSLPAAEFEQRAAELITRTLRGWILNRLLIAAAERSLTPIERQSIAGMRRLVREETIAQYGGGVPTIADQRLMQEKGFTLDEWIQRRMDAIVLQRHREVEIKNKVHASRREIERFFQDHKADFIPSPTVTIRMILVEGTTRADAVDALFAESKSFEEVARAQSQFRAAEGGLMDPVQLTESLAEFKELRWEPMNEAVRSLDKGQRSNRIDLGKGQFGWVMIEDLKSPGNMSLENVYLDVEKRVLEQKELILARQLEDKLLKEGNYSSPDAMLKVLQRVAYDRFVSRK